MEDIEKTNWWAYMDEPMRDLMRESFDLLKIDNNYHDYGFVVFPAAKAFEGFLKKLLYNLELLTKQQYLGDRFRIGKALNPNLPKRYQSDWVFGKLTDYCGGSHTPLLLWETWKRCRNEVFHYYPEHEKMTSKEEANERIKLIIEAMAKALAGCRV